MRSRRLTRVLVAMSQSDQPFELNRSLWDRLAEVHGTTPDDGSYDVPGFLAGTSALTETVRSAVGSVAGRDLLHLQCHVILAGELGGRSAWWVPPRQLVRRVGMPSMTPAGSGCPDGLPCRASQSSPARVGRTDSTGPSATRWCGAA
jgi:hypothetical protein